MMTFPASAQQVCNTCTSHSSSHSILPLQQLSTLPQGFVVHRHHMWLAMHAVALLAVQMLHLAKNCMQFASIHL